MTPFHDLIDKLFNWSGGSYVGLATITIISLAVAEFVIGVPKAFLVEGKTVVYIVHEAPTWFVSAIGVYTIVLTIFAVSRPINTLVGKVTPATPAPASAPEEQPLQK